MRSLKFEKTVIVHLVQRTSSPLHSYLQYLDSKPLFEPQAPEHDRRRLRLTRAILDRGQLGAQHRGERARCEVETIRVSGRHENAIERSSERAIE